MFFKGDIIITDPCYIITRDKDQHRKDWELCEYGDAMEKLGIKTYFTENTLYGDWSCTTYEFTCAEDVKKFMHGPQESKSKIKKAVIGEFCADAGLVSVFLLDEVLKYNPDFNGHTERPWSTTLIKNFEGNVYTETSQDSYVYNEETFTEPILHVVGIGNINFVTKQTGA